MVHKSGRSDNAIMFGGHEESSDEKLCRISCQEMLKNELMEPTSAVVTGVRVYFQELHEMQSHNRFLGSP